MIEYFRGKKSKIKIISLNPETFSIERGQTSFEYIAFVLILGLTILTFGKAFQDKIGSILQGGVINIIEQRFLSPENLHKFRIRK